METRLRTAINLQETGALLKAIKLARRADDALRGSPELQAHGLHESSIAEAEQLVAFLEVNLQLPSAIRARDQRKLKARNLIEDHKIIIAVYLYMLSV